jgi:hypothetical protein
MRIVGVRFLTRAGPGRPADAVGGLSPSLRGPTLLRIAAESLSAEVAFIPGLVRVRAGAVRFGNPAPEPVGPRRAPGLQPFAPFLLETSEAAGYLILSTLQGAAAPRFARDAGRSTLAPRGFTGGHPRSPLAAEAFLMAVHRLDPRGPDFRNRFRRKTLPAR